MSDKSHDVQKIISLPTGGGALKGIGETFKPNLFTGTGNYSIPLATSPGRNEFGPSLALEYSSGNGNGPFGMGWQLSIPRVTRKTEKGLPQYDDNDIFVISGVEDLVPSLKKTIDPFSGEDIWIPEEPIARESHTVFRYRARTEGLFARIERWENTTTAEIHWRAITKDNITNIYGGTASTRIADPENELRVYEWLLQETFDAAGNHISYEYARDNPQLYTNEDANLGLDAIFDCNRQATQLYIRRIYYGNLPNPLIDEQGNAITYEDGTEVGQLRGERRYALEVIFDYGDWDIATKTPHPGPFPLVQQELFGPSVSTSPEHNPVPIREDCFSSFRARFEVRTLRRCRRVLMFHHFAELGGPTLVRSADFDYQNDPDTRLSFLTSVTLTGYRKDVLGAYTSAKMPPVTFRYSEFRPHEQRYRSVAARGDSMPPFALNNPNVALVDLFGDGLPDVLHTSPTGFHYWRNLGGGLLDRPQIMSQIPAGIALEQSGVGFGDMGGDGQADLLVHSGSLPGFFETTSDGTWQTFKPYRVFPSFNLDDPNLRLVDLTGDGLSDALITEGDRFLWFECLGELGYAPPKRISRKHDLDEFPDLFFDDPAQRVRLADMTGSGLNDIVLIHNGRIEYWPNLGYGEFGRRITMANAPHFEVDFDPKRLFLADLNGTGCADLVYVDFDRVHFWFNQSGNSWSNTETIPGTPTISDHDAIQFADMFGTGTATLVWSYDFSAQPESNYKALDFCGGIKPYILTEMSNNLGATTRVSYAPSTKHFLDDQANGTPWLTRLPFPVQVVDKVEVIDHISKTKLVTTYKYHHGYFDGREREFRGFGRVDQFDTETFEDFTRSSLHGEETLFDNNSPAYHVPPVETRSWFHTGVYFDEDSTAVIEDAFDYRELTNRFRQEFYAGDTKAFVLGEHEVETEDAPFDAYRALHGALLRTEIYSRDGTAKAEHPYTVRENRFRVTEVQPKAANHHAVFFNHLLESLAYQYERNPADPRVSHEFTLDVDSFANPLSSIAIAYGRRQPDLALPDDANRNTQAQTLITYSQNSFTNVVDDPLDPDNYRTPLPSETRTYELTGFTPADDRRFTLVQWRENNFALLDGAAEIAYEETADLAQQQKRLIEHVRVLYRKNDLTELLGLGALESLGLPGESYKLALTKDLLDQVYVRNGQQLLPADPAEFLEGVGPDRGGYVDLNEDERWWIPSGRVFYSPNPNDTSAQEETFARQHFFSAHRSRDSFGNSAIVNYDAYNLLVKQSTDAVGNSMIADHDYRMLQPFRTIDPNGNRAAIVFDILGMVVGTAVMGKTSETVGDSLVGFLPDLTPQRIKAFFADPLGQAPLVIGQASTRFVYDLDRFRTEELPVATATLARETHASDPLPAAGLKIHLTISYSDAFGREVQRKLQAEPGPLLEGGPDINPRWVASGWTILNNKGKPVQQYEPFFDDTHEFRFKNLIGVSSTLSYDPLERVVATLHANHSWVKVVFDPWRQELWDVNDTALFTDPRTDPDVGEFFQRLPDSDYLPTWHALREGGSLGAEEQAAAAKTAIHAETPSINHADSLGRVFLAIAHNRFERNGAVVEEKYLTRTTFDIEGNQRVVIDTNERVIMRYDYDMVGTRIHQAGMETGEHWILNDVTGNPIYAWDSRDHRFHTFYDPLRRPTDVLMQQAAEAEVLIGRTIYGESAADPNGNLRGRIAQSFDQAGVLFADKYDFKGNLLTSRRHLAREYKRTIDWLTNPELETEIFTTGTLYDALNRATAVTTPDQSVYQARFNEANLLERVDVNVRGAQEAIAFVTNVNYNAKGQRILVQYGNGVSSSYEYDPATFRLTNLRTIRQSELLQDLTYTYDPAGNITSIRDDAQQTVYFNNQVVTASNEYTYDAIYRLIGATGREHIGQTSAPQTTFDDQFRVHLPHPGDGQVMRRYTEQYEYDGVGNFLQLIHQAVNGNWARSYEYNEPSQIEPARKSNRLSSTVVGNGNTITENYTYDEHGHMLRMTHLSRMDWDFGSHLQHVDLGGGGDAYYVYDAGGERVRKVIEKNGGTLIEERIYVGGFEVFRSRNGSGAITLERETLQVMDGKQRIALVETRTQGDDGSPAQLIRFQFGNHLGSASLELDDQAQIVSYEEYYSYGSTSYQAGRTSIEVRLKRYRYTGLERDEETGLSFHGARYYATWLGRWSSPDPLNFKHWDFSPYAYAALNPLRLVDPAGLEPNQTDPPKPPKKKLGPAEQELIREVDNWIAYVKKYPTEKAANARYEQLMRRAEELWISRLQVDPDAAQINYMIDTNKAKKFLDEWRAAAPEGTKLIERVAVSDLPEGTNVSYRETPWKDVLRDRLVAAGAKPPPTPPGGGGTPPPPPKGGGGFWGGVKKLFGGGKKTAAGSGGNASAPRVQRTGTSESPGSGKGGATPFVGPGINVLFGAWNIYNGVQDTGTECKLVEIGGGSLMLGGGLLQGAGLLKNSSSLLSLGGNVAFVGQIVLAPVVGYNAWQDINSGDPARAVTGAIDMSSIAVPPLAGISIYTKVFAPPAAEAATEVFHSASSRDMGEITGYAGASWFW